jgi:hypothetical protein
LLVVEDVFDDDDYAAVLFLLRLLLLAWNVDANAELPLALRTLEY